MFMFLPSYREGLPRSVPEAVIVEEKFDAEKIFIKMADTMGTKDID